MSGSAALRTAEPDDGRNGAGCRLFRNPLVSAGDAEARGPRATAAGFAKTSPEPEDHILKVMKYVTDGTFNVQLSWE
ncbi:hypothetical protein ACFCW6_06560 [Streptomyces sp. NPDC056333]|uniref:hypothetical protein n=1 Tax=Streptomyces sp. NPDC056333 TaxID=3345786 RepID=UPI0035DCE326